MPTRTRGFSSNTRDSQRGQALVYGLFLLIASLAGLFFLFNTGQLSREKTKLVNATDAAVYSAGAMHARALNFAAYTNRAMMANTIAIGQLVSVSSWVKYASAMGTHPASPLTNPKFLPYYPSYLVSTRVGEDLENDLVDSGLLEDIATGADKINVVLQDAQYVAATGIAAARQQVMEEVVAANYRNDGAAVVDIRPLGTQEFDDFVQRFEGDERQRFKDTIEVAMAEDKFVKKRSWKMDALWADCADAMIIGNFDWLERRGGTELVGFDEWKAMDTMSEWRWMKDKHRPFCPNLSEHPAGWGMQDAADSPTPPSPLYYDRAMIANPGSSGLAIAFGVGSEWDYGGLPSFYDLSDSDLDKEDPRLEFSARVTRDIGQTATSEGRSDIKQGPRLNNYNANAPGDVMAAVATSEVYFERPPAHLENVYGRSIGRSREIGSLFNPYWQVRLIYSAAAVSEAQTRQGAKMP